MFAKNTVIFYITTKKVRRIFANIKKSRTFASAIRGIAQPGRVRVWGACGRKFESCCPDYRKASIINRLLMLFLLEQSSSILSFFGRILYH